MRLLAGLLGLALAAWAGGGSVLLRNGTIHPVSGAVIERGSVLIEDGRITAVGERVRAPRGVQTVDVSGLHVYPGMIDSATELGLSEIDAVEATTDQAEIGEYHPQLRAVIAVNPASEHIPVTRANGITSAIALPWGGTLAGQAALIHLDGWTWEEMSVRDRAALHLDFPVLHPPRPASARRRSGDEPATFPAAEKQYRAKLQELGEYFEKARRYQKAKEAGGAAFRADVEYESMLPVLAQEMPVLVSATRRREIRAALDFAAEQKIRIILANPREVDEFLPELKEREIPVVLGPTLALPLDEDNPYDSSYTLPSRVHAAGVKFAIATFDTAFSRNLPYQAAMAVAFGLPREEALKAVTLNAAEIWGVSDEMGSIEKGKLGDLIVTDGDPLETRTQVKRIYIAGREIDPNDNRQHDLYERYQDRK